MHQLYLLRKPILELDATLNSTHYILMKISKKKN